jgi:hypothetical protein
VGHAIKSREAISVYTGSIAILSIAMHHWILMRMDILRATMHDGDSNAVRRFRELHVTGIALNFVLFASAIFAVTQIKL